jgi:hypothetical protein
MNHAGYTHSPPRSHGVPAELLRYLDGTDLLAKTQALRLSTVDPAGWPHASLLSAGDMLALQSGRIRLAFLSGSASAQNLVRDGRLTLTVTLDGGMCELRLHARPIGPTPADLPLALFEAQAESARMHVAPYAVVTSGVTFALDDPQTVLARWRKQIEALRVAR